MAEVTKLEMEILNLIKDYTENEFSSDTPMWAYTNYLKCDMKVFRGVISSLVKKGIVTIESYQKTNDAVSVKKIFWLEDEINYVANFINLEVK